MTRRRAALALAPTLVGTVVALLLGWATPAGAHAVLLESDPADGAVLETAPSAVELSFNESVRVADDAVVVIDPSGTPIDGVTAAATDRTVRIDLPGDLADGTHVVSWRIVSADSHPMDGALTFSIGAPSSVAPTVTFGSAEPGWGFTVGRGIVTAVGYLGVLGAAGLWFFRLLVHDDAANRRPLDALTVGFGGIGIVGILLGLPLHIVALEGDGLGVLTDGSRWADTLGDPTGIEAAVTIAASTTLIGITRWGPARRGPWTSIAAAFASIMALAGFVIAGHTRTFGPAALVIGADLLHLLTAALWFGGLVGLWTVHRSGSHRDDPGSFVAVVTRFSTTAAISLGTVAVSGLVLGWRIVGAWSPLVTTGYGRTLLIKVLLVALTAGLGAANRFLLPRAAAGDVSGVLDRVRRIVRTEILVLIAVTLAAGFLVNQSPVDSRASSASTDTASEPQQLTVTLGDLEAEIRVEPGRTGENRIRIEFPEPVDPVTAPELSFTQEDAGVGPLSATATPDGAGSFDARIDLPVDGNWSMRLDLRMDDFDKRIGVAELPIGG